MFNEVSVSVSVYNKRRISERQISPQPDRRKDFHRPSRIIGVGVPLNGLAYWSGCGYLTEVRRGF